MTITRVIRYRPLRRSTAVKFLWWYLTAHHDLTAPQVIKVRTMAETLGLRIRTTRRALRALVRARYLDPVVLPTGGTPGEYVAGPRAYRQPAASTPLPRTRRGHRGPRPHPSQLTLGVLTDEDSRHAA
ncbi:MAG: hypothetical protein ACK6DP_12440 [Gemmatimonas sp.]|jgi:hypothetical protein|uniref:hypothetical protein n=1 Tax=Gemmatimonas sp. TaxID=1962908 RepID=UPI00391F0B92